jgi:hypothetical protein
MLIDFYDIGAFCCLWYDQDSKNKIRENFHILQTCFIIFSFSVNIEFYKVKRIRELVTWIPLIVSKYEFSKLKLIELNS